jgi:hypothetical protein
VGGNRLSIAVGGTAVVDLDVTTLRSAWQQALPALLAK